MTRRLVASGLPGPGQEPFPETAKEMGRRLGLYPNEVVWLKWGSSAGSGANRDTYTPTRTVRGRLDPIGTRGFSTTRGDVISEATTHVVTVDATLEATTKDRFQILGTTWIITGQRTDSGRLINQYEVKAL